MSRNSRKGGKEVGLVLVGREKVEAPVQKGPAFSAPIDCSKPEYRHLRTNQRRGYVSLAGGGAGEGPEEE